MHKRQQLLFDALRRIDEFADRRAEAIGGASKAPCRRDVRQAVRSLDFLAGEQCKAQALTRRQTIERQRLRLDLKATMQPVATLAKAYLSDSPHAEGLRMPRHLCDRELIAAAIEMAEAARYHARDFTRLQLPAQSIRDLHTKAMALEEAGAAREATMQRVTAATAAIKDVLSRAARDVMVLNAIIRMRIKHDAVLLEEWQAAMQMSPLTSRSITPQPYSDDAEAA